MNNVTLAGRIYRMSEQVGLQKQVTYLTIICRHRQYDEFVDVVCFGQKASFVNQYFKEKQWIGIQGHLHNNKSDRGYKLEVIADDISFIGAKPTTTTKSEYVETVEWSKKGA